MRRLRTLICLPLLALPLSAAGTLTAHAESLGDVGHVQCTAQGSMQTSAGLTAESVRFTASLILNCTGVGADDNGQWVMSLSGQLSPGACAGAEGLATVSGSGPDGSFSAGVNLSFDTASVTISGTLGTGDAGGDAFNANLVVAPTSGTPCVDVNTQESLTGQASITDQPPPPDLVFCTANGGENYNPGEALAVQSVAVAGTANLNCTNPVSDDRGAWAINYNGTASADCGLAEGTLAMAYAAPDGSGGGDIDYERVGTLLQMVGNSTDNTFAIWANLSFSGTCATTPFFGAAYSGPAAVVE
jgi:hypothetical protein